MHSNPFPFQPNSDLTHSQLLWGQYKTWTLDHGLDSGLNNGLNHCARIWIEVMCKLISSKVFICGLQNLLLKWTHCQFYWPEYKSMAIFIDAIDYARAMEPQRPGLPWLPHFLGQFFFFNQLVNKLLCWVKQ